VYSDQLANLRNELAQMVTNSDEYNKTIKKIETCKKNEIALTNEVTFGVKMLYR
jgi:hypothetical protein